MDDVPLVVRVAANLTDLRANLLEGVNQIETTSTAMRQMATAYDGSRAISQAGAVMAAIQAVGGVTHLTAQEQAQANTVLDAALQKYAALGQTAPPGMQAIADATKKVGDSFGEWVGKFDIEHAISDPIGTAKEGLLAFVETLGPAGVALAGAAAVAAAVGGALYEIASKAAEAGEKTEEFALVTGTAIEKVGAIGATAIIAGSSLEGMQSMLTQMQRRLDETGEPAQKFNAALSDLGINANAFRAADPSDRINILSDGMQRSAGSTNLMTDALAIMGKSGVQNIKFLMENTEAVRAKAEELAYTWSHDDTEASNDFNHAVAELGVGVTTLSTAIGVALLPAMTKIVEGVERIGVAVINVTGLPGYIALFHTLTDAMGNADLKEQTLLATMDTANHLFAEVAKEGYSLADAATEVATRMLAMGAKEEVVATATGLTLAAVQLLKIGLKEAATEADAFAAVWDKINANSAAAGAGIAGVSAATQALIVQEKAEGATLEQLAQAWLLAPQQIKQILDAHAAGLEAAKKAVTDLAAAQKAADAVIMATYTGQLATLRQIETQRAKSYGTEAQIAMLGQQRIAEDALTAAVYAQLNSEKDRMTLIEAEGKRHAEITNQMMALEAQLSQTRASQILLELQAQQRLDAAWAKTTGAVQDEVSAEEVLRQAIDKLNASTDVEADKVIRLAELYKDYTDKKLGLAKASDVAREGSDKLVASVAAVPATVNAASSAMYGLINTMSDYKQFGQEGWFGWAPTGAMPVVISLPSTPGLTTGAPDTGTWTPPPSATHRATGGPVSSGMPYMVGERGPELFVPSGNGSILPNGVDSGGTVYNTFNIVDTEANIVRRVSDQITRSILQLRKLSSS